MPRLHRAVIFLAIFVCTAGFDQGSKQWARTLPVVRVAGAEPRPLHSGPANCGVADLAAHRCAGVPQPVIEGYWDWQLAMNSGVAFSTFAGITGAQILLSILAAIALIAIGVMAARTMPAERMKRVAFALIAGGALGNLIDRVRDGAVTDFIRWRAGDHLWPVFNVADVALLVGVGLLLVESALRRRRHGMIKA